MLFIRGKAAGQILRLTKAKDFCGICICVLQPGSMVPPTAVTEAGAQPQKDGEKRPSFYITTFKPPCK